MIATSVAPRGSVAMERRVRISTFIGQVLMRLAGEYPTLQDVILELVQNALDIDVQADRITVVLNYRTKHMAVRDNGKGSTIQKFDAALASVAKTGRKGPGSLGQFAIGLISPLGKCKSFTFVSCPAPHKEGFHEWKFDCNEVLSTGEDLTIPARPRHDLIFGGGIVPGKTQVQWRSEVSLTGITTDAYVSRVDIDALVGAIQSRYSTTMRKNQAKISIEITDIGGNVTKRENVMALDFIGDPLPVRTFESKVSGKTMFRFFIAPKKKGYKGKVVMGVDGNDFRFPFRNFVRTATDFLDAEVIQALSGGLFEGEIISEKAELHQDRNTFVKNDAFIELCCAIQEWYEQFGAEYVKRFSEQRQEVRLQELALRSLKVIDLLLKDPAHLPLLQVIKSFSCGTVGTGHVVPPKKKVFGLQDLTALSTDGNPGTARKEGAGGDGKSHNDSRNEKDHTPLTAAGPKGPHRKLVKHGSLGLQFAHEKLDGDPDLWKLDTGNGVLTFNIRHPLWEPCSHKDSTLMKLQECVAMEALTLHMMPESGRLLQRKVLDELNHSLVTWILMSDKIRVSGSKDKDKEAA